MKHYETSTHFLSLNLSVSHLRRRWNASDKIYHWYRDSPKIIRIYLLSASATNFLFLSICYLLQSQIYSTYILRCADNTLYTGITTDVERRIVEHNHDDKKWARYTRARRPVELVYSEKHASRSEACRREYEIKRMTREEKENLVKNLL